MKVTPLPSSETLQQGNKKEFYQVGENGIIFISSNYPILICLSITISCNTFTESEYLERVIVSAKGSIERAKSRVNKMCKLRTALPEFFDKHHARKDFSNLENCL